MILTGFEKFGFVLLFYTPDEFYIKLVSLNESIKLSKIKQKTKVPSKNEISATSKFLIEHNSEYVLCEILDDLKFDEIFCQVLLCNSNIKLKVDYRKLLYLNSDDIVNDETCISLKFHDFAPNQKNWSPDIISRLRKLMLFNKFVFHFKSFEVDPFDGRYPVEVLNFQERKCLNDQFIEENLAVRSSEYFKEKMENELTQIFYSKIDKCVRYKVSVPLAKVKPKSRPKATQIKSLNVCAQPFFPLRESNETLKSKENSTISVSNSNPIGLQSNIVNMFSEMYRNRQEKINKSFILPFSSYQTIFPSYGGVNFSKETHVSTINKPNQLKNNILNQSSDISVCQQNVSTIYTTGMNAQAPSFITTPNISNKTPDITDCQQNVSTIYTTGMNAQAPSFIMPSNIILKDQLNGLPENPNFQQENSTLLNVCSQYSVSDSQQILEISEESSIPSYVISKPPVFYESSHQELKPDNLIFDNNKISPSSIDYSESVQPKFSSFQSLLTNGNHTSHYQVNDSQKNSTLNTDSVISSLNNLTLSQSSSNLVIDSKPLYSSYPSTPLNSYPTIWHPSIPPPHSFGNVIIQAPMMPSFEYMKRFPVPANFQSFAPMAFNPIHQDNLLKFHPNFRPEPSNFINNCNIFKFAPKKESKDEENHQINIVEKPTDNNNASISEGMWIQSPLQIVPPSPQSGRIHVQPINLIYYQPDR